jgi:hypothetical protein
MSVLSKIDHLTKPTTIFAKNIYVSTSAAILGACALNSWPGAITAAAIAPFIPSSVEPRKRLLTAVVISTIKWAVEHYSPNHSSLSYCTGLLPLLYLGPTVIRDTILTTSVGIAGSLITQYHLDKVFFAASLEFLTLTALWRQGKSSMLFGALAASALATSYLTYPHYSTYFIHPSLILGSFLVSKLIKDRNIFSWSNPDGPSSPRRRRPPPKRGAMGKKPDPQPSTSRTAPASPVKKKGTETSTFNKRGGPAFSPVRKTDEKRGSFKGVWKMDSDSDDDQPVAPKSRLVSIRAREDIFADGIPEHLKRDQIFRLFKCDSSREPICFEPLYNKKYNIFLDGKTAFDSSKRLWAPLIPMPKIKALIEAHKDIHRQGDVLQLDVRFLKEARDELRRYCSFSPIIKELQALIDQEHAKSSRTDEDEDLYGSSTFLREATRVFDDEIDWLSTPPESPPLSNPVRDSFAYGPHLIGDPVLSIFKHDADRWFKPGNSRNCDICRLTVIPEVAALIEAQKQFYRNNSPEVAKNKLPDLSLMIAALYSLSPQNPEESKARSSITKLINRKMGEDRDVPQPQLSAPRVFSVAAQEPRISCSNGIPHELREDVIFSLCPFILERTMPDFVLDPNDRQTINWRIKLEQYLERGQKGIELPKFNALLRERMRFCDQKLREGMPIDQLKVTLPENRSALLEALLELTSLCPTSETRKSLSKILGFAVPDTFANGVPTELHEDMIFSLCKCILQGTPCGDLVLDPTDHKTIYSRKAAQVWLNTVNTTSPVTGHPLKEEQLVELPKLNALFRERQQFYQKTSIATPFAMWAQHLPDNRACRQALEEATKLCPTSEVTTKLCKILGVEPPRVSVENSNNAPPARVNKISFANGIPDELQEDMIFSSCSCGIDLGPSFDWVLDPTDMKTLYDRKTIAKSLAIKKESPTTRKPLKEDKLIEIPELNALFNERKQFYEQKDVKDISQFLKTPPENSSCLREALRKVESQCPEAEVCNNLRRILSADPKNWDFSNGIPPELYNDCVFSLFICPITKKPILDFALDKNEMKIPYDSATLRNMLTVTKRSTGDILSLPKLSSLVNVRKREFMGLIGSGAKLEQIEAKKKTPPDAESLRAALEEAQKLCPDSDVVTHLNKFHDSGEKFAVFVKMGNGSTKSILVSKNDKIGKICELIETDPNKTLILYAGRRLDQNQKIADYQISKESTILVLINARAD